MAIIMLIPSGVGPVSVRSYSGVFSMTLYLLGYTDIRRPGIVHFPDRP
jgi:hypothetical protein